jgi:hypothetical protein
MTQIKQVSLLLDKVINIPPAISAIGEISNEFHKAGVLSKDVIVEIYRKALGFQQLNSAETGCGKSTLLFS